MVIIVTSPLYNNTVIKQTQSKTIFLGSNTTHAVTAAAMSLVSFLGCHVDFTAFGYLAVLK